MFDDQGAECGMGNSKQPTRNVKECGSSVGRTCMSEYKCYHRMQGRLSDEEKKDKLAVAMEHCKHTQMTKTIKAVLIIRQSFKVVTPTHKDQRVK